MMQRVLSLIVAILASTALGELRVRNVSCDDSKQACKIELELDESTVHVVNVDREERSVFADTAVSAFLNGEETLVSTRKTLGTRFHTRQNEQVHSLATALIDVEKSTLVDGIFLTKTHGIVEIRTIAGLHSVTRHRDLSSASKDVVLEHPDGKFWLKDNLQMQARTIDTWDPTATPFGQVIPFFPQCYTGDSVTHVFQLNIVFDYGLYSTLASQVAGDANAKMNQILSDLETNFALGKLLYLMQFNIRVEINKIIFGKAGDPLPLSQGGPGAAACNNALGSMDQFMSYLSKTNAADPTGYWLLVSNCFSGINGVSYVGSICGTSLNGGVAAYSWLVMFHELGHGFGSTHSFENGVGTTGGIMDYGDPQYNGVIQFHPLKRAEVCPFLDYVVQNSQCTFLYPTDSQESCGDGILSAGEQCECLNKGSTNCDKCVNCHVTDASVQCSTDNFVVRQASTPNVAVVSPTLLSDSMCCFGYKLAQPKTLCGAGNLNVCAGGGQCMPVCTKLLYSNNPNCGFDSSGCQLGCVWSNKCRFDMTFTEQDGSTGLISGVPDGTSCFLPSGAKGVCDNSACVASLPNSATPRPSSLAQENTPTVNNDIPTPRPSVVTRAPATPRPSTAKPTKASKRAVRTPYPTRRPTSFPTPKPPAQATQQETIRCAQAGTPSKCKKRGCAWCAKLVYCVPKGACS